jgi:hypothetical protein
VQAKYQENKPNIFFLARCKSNELRSIKHDDPLKRLHIAFIISFSRVQWPFMSAITQSLATSAQRIAGAGGATLSSKSSRRVPVAPFLTLSTPQKKSQLHCNASRSRMTIVAQTGVNSPFTQRKLSSSFPAILSRSWLDVDDHSSNTCI